MKIDDWNAYAGSILATCGTAAVTACYWFARRVLTDTKRLSLLEQRQNLQHKEIVNALDETRNQVSRIEASNDQTAATQARVVDVLDRMERRVGNE